MSAPTRRPNRRRLLLAAAVAGALAAGTLTAYLALRGGGHPAAAAPATTPAAPSTPAPTTPAPSTSTPTSQPPAVPHDRVAPAAPTAFTLTGPRFTIKARV